MIGSATSVVGNTALLNHTGEASDADAQAPVSDDKPVDVYEGNARKPAKETQAQAETQAQQAQQGACATKKRFRFGSGGLFKRSPKRQAQKNMDAAVRDQVNGRCAKGSSVANLLPAAEAAKGASQSQNACASANDNLHALAQSVIKYTHTGLHLHAVKRNNAASALCVVQQTQALLDPAVNSKAGCTDRRLKRDARRLERHRRNLARKVAK